MSLKSNNEPFPIKHDAFAIQGCNLYLMGWLVSMLMLLNNLSHLEDVHDRCLSMLEYCLSMLEHCLSIA